MAKLNLETVIEKLYEDTNNSIKKDVLTWLEGENIETVEDAINLLNNVRCENADVSHLVYNYDISSWVYEHEDAILEIINGLIDTDLHDLDDINWEQHDDLANVLNNWESGESRYDVWRESVLEEAVEMAEEENEDWDSLDEDERLEIVNEALDVLFYRYDVFELTKTDKAQLAWLSFEYEAQNLAEEFGEIEKEKEGE